MGRQLVVEADGGSRGNPGVAGYGALVRDPATGRVLWEGAAPLGKESNNVAEYSGLIAGLRAAQRIDAAAQVEARLDSKLVVEQMSGRWKIKHEDMRRLALEARELAALISRGGGSVTYTWIPREKNKDADALSNDGMDGRTIDRMVGEPGPSTSARPSADASPEAVDEIIDEIVDTIIDPAPGTAAPPPVAGPGAPTRLVLVRHGVTDFTVHARLDGRGGSDPSLNASGHAQAQAAGAAVTHLLGGVPARVVTSSLTRAVETGAAVAAAIGVHAEQDGEWDEQDFGDWDGVSVHDLAREQPAELALMRSDAAYARPGGETHLELTERVVAAYERVVAAGGTTVVVCHRKPIMVVLAHVLGIPHDKIWRVAAAPGSLTALEVWPDGNVSVAFTNRT